MSRRATITVCIPTRNRAASLRRTMAAMRWQTAPFDEMIVGDDASEDNTAEVVDEFRDDRIRYIRHPRNLGLYQNWNHLIASSSGDYICIYHDHDAYLPEILQRSRALLDECSDMAFVHTAVLLVDGNGSPVDSDIRPFPRVMAGRDLCDWLARNWHSPVMAATAMVRREAYRMAGPYQPELYGLGCDKHMWFRLAQGGSVGYVQDPQALIRTREKGTDTARFSWPNEWGTLRMREQEIAEALGADPDALAEARRCLSRETTARFLRWSIRALLLEAAENWGPQERNVLARMAPWARHLYLAVKRHPMLQNLARSTGLQIHYARTASRERAAMQNARSLARRMGIETLAGKPLRRLGDA